MKKNQDGFSVVEGLLILVVVGLIGSAGYYVYRSQETKESTQSTAETTQGTDSTTEEEPKETHKTFENADLSLKYLADWSVDPSETKFVSIKSADFKANDADSSGLGAAVTAGYWLTAHILPTGEFDSYASDLENAPSKKDENGGFYEVLKIDGNNAVLSNSKTHGSYLYAKAYKNGKTYSFTLHAVDDDATETKQVFKVILESVKIK